MKIDTVDIALICVVVLLLVVWVIASFIPPSSAVVDDEVTTELYGRGNSGGSFGRSQVTVGVDSTANDGE